MLEHAEVFGNLYGTPRAPVEAAIGARAGRALRRGLAGRPADPQLVPARRGGLDLHPAAVDRRAREPAARPRPGQRRRWWPSAWRSRATRSATGPNTTTCWSTRTCAQCEAELRAIIAAERLRRDRRPELMGLVRRLNRGIRGAADMSLYALDGVAPELPADGDCLGGAGRAADRPGACWTRAPRSGSTRCCAATTSRSWSGEGSNVQDGCVCHTDIGFPLTIGADCTIGHMAILHGCTIGEGSLVGMGATVLNGAVIGQGRAGRRRRAGHRGQGDPRRRAGGRPAGQGGARPDAGGDRRPRARSAARLPRQHGALQGRASASAGLTRRCASSAERLAEARLEPVAGGRRAPGAAARTARRRAAARRRGAPSVTCAQSSAGGAVRRPSTASVIAAVGQADPHRAAHRQALLEAEDREIDEPRQRPRQVAAAAPPRRR